MPVMPQMRPELETIFSRYENGGNLLGSLYLQVGTALLHGIRWIFMISAILMVALSVLNLLLKDVPLRHGPPPPSESVGH